MFRFIFRLLWRIIILALGLCFAWAIVTFYAYTAVWLPAFVAVFIAYCICAYGLAPLLIRLFRIVIKSDHIPLYVTTRDGWPSDPVNIAIIATNRQQLESSMQAAGWSIADPLTFMSGCHEIASMIFNTPYKKAPLSRLYLFGRPHDVGFEIPTSSSNSARTRHHVRFWRLQEPLQNEKHPLHYDFWTRKLSHLVFAKKELWIGAATEETHAIDIQWFTGQLTHGGSHDADGERDYIISTLNKSNRIKSHHTTRPGKQIKFRGQQFRTFYTTDGGIKVIRLR